MKKQSRAMADAIAEKPLYLWDYAIFLVLAIFCALSFQQGDLLHTAGCSYGYLNGHILDFYDYCGSYNIHPSYMPSMYLLFAIWNIPMRVLGVVTFPTDVLPVTAIMWAKMLPCLLYLLSGIIIYKICMEIGMGSKKSKICMYACLTMPIGFFSQFIFGQYDIFMLFCMLLGVYYYLKHKDYYFIFWFGIAITFKYSALLVFLPLLLLKTKSVWKILTGSLMAAVPYGIEYLCYRGSEAFSNYAFGIGSSGDNPTGYIFNASYFTGFQLSGMQFSVSLVILGFGIVCGLAYFTKIKEKRELISWTFYLSSLVFFVLYGLAKWHPQWLLLAVPFWVISAFIHKDTKIFLVIDIIFMLIYTIFNVTMIPNNVDQIMFNNGIFRRILGGNIGTKMTMGNIMGVLDPSMCVSLITVIMLVYAVFKHPKYCAENFAAPVDNCMGWIRTRLIVGVAIFVVPAFMCFFAHFTGSVPTYQILGATGGIMLPSNGEELSQRFLSQGTSIDQIQFPIIVNGQINEADLKVSIRETNTGKTIYEEERNVSKWYDEQLIQIRPQNLKVKDQTYYDIVFLLTPREQNCKVALHVNNQFITKNKKETAYINKKEQSFQIQMTVYQE